MKKKNDGESFVFYRSFLEAINLIDDVALKLQAFNAICEYALNGKMPEADCEGIVKIVFTMAKPQIDANKKRRENGGKSHQTNEKSNSTDDTNGSQCDDHWLSDEQPNVNGNDNVNGNGNGNGNVNYNDNENENINNHPIGSSLPMCRPTEEQVRQYCEERNNGINAKKFIDWYDSRGWDSIKDWKATIRVWETYEKKKPVDCVKPSTSHISEIREKIEQLNEKLKDESLPDEERDAIQYEVLSLEDSIK